MAVIFWETALQLKLPAGHPMGVTEKSGAAAVEATVVGVIAVTEETAQFGWTNMVHQPVLTSV